MSSVDSVSPMGFMKSYYYIYTTIKTLVSAMRTRKGIAKYYKTQQLRKACPKSKSNPRHADTLDFASFHVNTPPISTPCFVSQ